MKNRFKNNIGITLIALVITIIVLLILAGVAISMLSGENGILKKAAEAKTNTEESQKQEMATLIDYEIDSHFILNNSKYKCRNGYITGVTFGEVETEEGKKEIKIIDTVNDLNEALKGTGYVVAIYPDSENGKYVERNITDTTMKLKNGMGIKKEGETDGEAVARVIIFGDVNSDNKITEMDASFIKQLRAGMISPDANWVFLSAFDVNHDGKLDKEDVSCALLNTIDRNNEEYYEIDQSQYAMSPNKLKIIYFADVEKEYLENVFPENSKYRFEYDESRKDYVLKGAPSGEPSTNIKSLIPGARIHDEDCESVANIKEGCHIELEVDGEKGCYYDIVL